MTRILNAENCQKMIIKICKKWENVPFWKVSKSFKTHPNLILSSGKNSYQVFEPEFWKWEYSTKEILFYGNFSSQGRVLSCFWKVEKSDFSIYIFKKKFYGLVDRWKKNLWSLPITSPNISFIDPTLPKIFNFQMGTFFCRLIVVGRTWVGLY